MMRLFILPLLFICTTAFGDTITRTVKAKITKVVGDNAVYALPDSKDFKKLEKGLLLPHGTTIKTGEDSMVYLVIAPGAASRIAANSELILEKMTVGLDGEKPVERRAHLKLNSGMVSSMLNKDVPTNTTDFKIITPHGTSAARGTFFAVTCDEKDSFIKVKEGKVWVEPNDEGFWVEPYVLDEDPQLAIDIE